jgi:hypothetical protein
MSEEDGISGLASICVLIAALLAGPTDFFINMTMNNK